MIVHVSAGLVSWAEIQEALDALENDSTKSTVGSQHADKPRANGAQFAHPTQPRDTLCNVSAPMLCSTLINAHYFGR